MHNIKKQRGFTLIELLMVISIISLMSSIVFTSLSDARLKARDAVRKRDFNEIQKALELYYLQHGQYPFGQKNSIENEMCASDWSCWSGEEEGLATYLSPYIKYLPQDPSSEKSSSITCGNWFYYVYERKSANSYCLAGNLENKKDPEIKTCSVSCHRSWPNYYFLKN